MIRGVNRQVIEVRKTGSIYFERALLVVNPLFSDAGRRTLDQEAREIMGRLTREEDTGKRTRRLKRVAMLLGAAIAGALTATLILMLQ